MMANEAERRVQAWIDTGDIEAVLDLDELELEELPLGIPDNIKRLTCSHNNLATLPRLPRELVFFNCGFNQLTLLPSLPNGLNEMYCNDNNLRWLPMLPPFLRVLDCHNNRLTIVPPIPNGLSRLFLSNNNLHEIPRLPPSVIELSCAQCGLRSLPPLPFVRTLQTDPHLQYANRVPPPPPPIPSSVPPPPPPTVPPRFIRRFTRRTESSSDSDDEGSPPVTQRTLPLSDRPLTLAPRPPTLPTINLVNPFVSTRQLTRSPIRTHAGVTTPEWHGIPLPSFSRPQTDPDYIPLPPDREWQTC